MHLQLKIKTFPHKKELLVCIHLIFLLPKHAAWQI